MNTEKQKDIQEKVTEWAHYNLAGFEFRKYQFETIVKIIYNILEDKRETTIIEAPTGSGKSLICLISAGVLSKYYGKRSYILCSDLYLWKQYADFITEKHLPFGALKGAKGNYICHENNQDITLGICRLCNVPYRSLCDAELAHELGYDCARACEYICARKQAIRSSVTLMTYQLWLNYVNYTDGETFSKRDVIFCDECHNIPSIIQMFCQPTISPKTQFNALLECFQYGIKQNLQISTANIKYANKWAFNDDQSKLMVAQSYVLPTISDDINKYFNEIYDTDNKQKILSAYSEFFHIVRACKNIATLIVEAMKKGGKKKLSKEKEKLLRHAEFVVEYHDSLYNFMQAISLCGENCLDYLVKNNSMDSKMNRSVTFACSKEDLLCNQYLLSNSPYKVMLSATVGAKAAYDENIGIKYTTDKCSEMFRIPSTFDFSTSPVYYLPTYKMSKNYIDQNLPILSKIIGQLVSGRHAHQKGIIHTGSYKNTMALINNLPPEAQCRCYNYENSREKDDVLMEFEDSADGILVGPTLTEGIDLPDDACRFIIIMKVPYPNLGDNLVQSKTKLFPGWYDSETSNTVIQAIGRGNRHPKDWCVTYILDGNFGALYAKTQAQYSPELQARIVTLRN